MKKNERKRVWGRERGRYGQSEIDQETEIGSRGERREHADRVKKAVRKIKGLRERGGRYGQSEKDGETEKG